MATGKGTLLIDLEAAGSLVNAVIGGFSHHERALREQAAQAVAQSCGLDEYAMRFWFADVEHLAAEFAALVLAARRVECALDRLSRKYPEET